MSDLADLLDLMPFARKIGIRLTRATADEVVAELDWQEDLCTAGGVLHGGALMSLADTAGAVCAYVGLPPGASTTTTTSTTHLLRPGRSGTVTATSRPVHRGRTSAVVQTDITGADGRLMARTTQVQAIMNASS